MKWTKTTEEQGPEDGVGKEEQSQHREHVCSQRGKLTALGINPCSPASLVMSVGVLHAELWKLFFTVIQLRSHSSLKDIPLKEQQWSVLILFDPGFVEESYKPHSSKARPTWD